MLSSLVLTVKGSQSRSPGDSFPHFYWLLNIHVSNKFGDLFFYSAGQTDINRKQKW